MRTYLVHRERETSSKIIHHYIVQFVCLEFGLQPAGAIPIRCSQDWPQQQQRFSLGPALQCDHSPRVMEWKTVQCLVQRIGPPDISQLHSTENAQVKIKEYNLYTTIPHTTELHPYSTYWQVLNALCCLLCCMASTSYYFIIHIWCLRGCIMTTNAQTCSNQAQHMS